MLDSRLFLVFIAAVLFGCQTTPRSYRNLGWAKVSVQEAEARCYAEINKPGGVPNLYLCMRAMGWSEN